MLGPNRLVKVFSPIVIVGSASFIAGIAATIVFISFKQLPNNAYAVAQLGQITNTIRTSGTVEPTQSIDLGFPRAGVINRIAAGAGEPVRGKQLLASISGGDLTNQLGLAQANLNNEKAKLAALESGPSPDELAALDKDLAGELSSSYQAGSAARSAVDQFITGGDSPSLTFQTSDAGLAQEVIDERGRIQTMLASWQSELPSTLATTSSGVLLTRATSAADHLSAVDTFLNHAAEALARAITSPQTPADTLVQYQNTVSNARLSIANALTALTAAAGKLSLAEAPASTTASISAQNAAIVAAQTKVDTLNAQIAEGQLKAPIGGTIAKVLHGVGDSITSGQPVFVLSSNAHFEIVAALSPEDSGKTAVGQDASVVLKNNSNRTWPAKVVATSPSKVTIQFTEDDPSIKLGQAGDITILSTAIGQALLVPQSAIVVRGGKSYVLRQNSGNPNAAGANKAADILVPVETGITTTGGNIQILSGLAPGDKVRTSIGIY